ncbi:MAG TPA: hypothetical protein PLF37_15570, partial [Planctomycetota bacterium]|nr:hypothetical protein [Planctomycetota bacterium]
PKPEEPKPDQPKPDKPKSDDYAETGYEHLRGAKKGHWAAMETKSSFGGNESRMIQRFIFDRVEGDLAFLKVESWTFMANMAEPFKSESDMGNLPLKYKKPEGDQPSPEAEPKIEKGEETITLAGREWNCRRLKVTTVSGGKEVVTTVWIAKDKLSFPAVGMAGGGRATVRMEMKMGDDWSNSELIALGTDADSFTLPGAGVEQPKPEEPKPEEPKPEDEWVEKTIPGAAWLRNCVKGDWVLIETESNYGGQSSRTFAVYIFDGLEGDDAVLRMDTLTLSPGQDWFALPNAMKISTVDKKERVRKGESEAAPATEEETITLNGREFLCEKSSMEVRGTTTRSWTVKDKTDPRQIGLAFGAGLVQSTSEGSAGSSTSKVIAWGEAAEDYKAKAPKPPEAEKPPEEDTVTVVIPSPYRHLKFLEPGTWVIMVEDIKGHLLNDRAYTLIKFNGMDGEHALVSVETTLYATGRPAETSKEDLRLNTADDVKKYPKGEAPEAPKAPEITEEKLLLDGTEYECLRWTREGEPLTRVWRLKNLNEPRALGLAGRKGLIGRGLVRVEVRDGELRNDCGVHKWGSAMETPEIPGAPHVEQPKPEEPKPEEEWVEVVVPGAKWLADCKQGDWVLVEMHSKGSGFESKSWIRFLFVRLDGDDAVLLSELHMENGMSVPGTESRVRVTDKVERFKKGEGVRTQPDNSGEETLRLGDRDFACEWREDNIGGASHRLWTFKDKTDPRMIGLAGGGYG